MSGVTPTAMAVPVREALAIDVLAIERELPDTRRAGEFDGVAMVESFRLPLPDGGHGRCWIATAEALAIPGFGRGWIARALRARGRRQGEAELVAALAAPSGCRLSAADGG
jgi:hypothetical protein